MKKTTILFIVCFVWQTVSSQSPLDVKTLKLDNGFTVWLNEDHTQATVFGAVVVNAGAKDSPATGIAHYFEHIMFKGTDKIGTIDYASEKVYLDSIAATYDLLAQTADDGQRKEIQKEINRLSIEAANYVIPNEFNTLISKMGGSGLNAGTGFDQTVYYNVFVPQHINQWLELNSERLINPVFRLFQGELETVYEEKNMYNDRSFNVAMEKALERALKPHPYQYPIIGLTEHLKNPSLSDMEQFYKNYYKAGNMGLILSGDFDSEKVIPVIMEKFGRLPSGYAPEIPVPEIPPFNGKETERMLVPIPLVKISAMMWHGITNGSPDEITLRAAQKLLSNSSQTGYLNLLGTDGKLLMADMQLANFNDAGIILTLVIPKLFFQSYGKAEGLVINEINRIKNGDFTEEDLESVKLEMKREFEMQLETFASKATLMANLFSQGKEWSDYLQEQETIGKLTKNDIMGVANRYFTDNYLDLTKKKGRYKMENVTKAGFAPIVPPNRNESSEYAKKLMEEAAANPVTRPRTINFDKDAETVAVTPMVTLYAKENPVNSIFNLQLVYRKGNLADNMVQLMSEYVNDLPTDSLSYKDFKNGLRKLGGTVDFSSEKDAFIINITGFEENMEPTLHYISRFIQQVKPDDKAIKRIIAAEKINRKTIKSESENIADALFTYAIHGTHSTYLTMPSISEIKRKGKDGLLAVFREVIQTECDIHYSGKKSVEDVKRLVTRYFEPEKIIEKADKPVEFPLQRYDKPVVFVLDIPKAKQSIIYGYTFSPTEIDRNFINASRLFNAYFGGGMSSILFQEIREFRSFAYGTSSQFVYPGIINKENGSYLKCYLSTQSDKTVEALAVLDSLLRDMPQHAEKLSDAKQSLRNNINNNYPPFRNLTRQIAALKRQGYDEDLNQILLESLDEMDMRTIVDFYSRHVKENTTCYVITGNMKQVDMEQLKQFGEVRKIKIKDIIR